MPDELNQRPENPERDASDGAQPSESEAAESRAPDAESPADSGGAAADSEAPKVVAEAEPADSEVEPIDAVADADSQTASGGAEPGAAEAPEPAGNAGASQSDPREAELESVAPDAESDGAARAGDEDAIEWAVDAAVGAQQPGPDQYEPMDFSAGESAHDPHDIDLLDDVELDVKVELGRANLYIEDVLRLGVGSVVELDRLAGDPVDIYVNDKLVARGEVLVLSDNFCVRVNDIVSPIPGLGDAE